MNGSTPKNLNTSNNSNASSNSQIRLSYLRPPQTESKVPSFLQQTRVSLYIPKHDNDLPDYSNSPVQVSDDQRSVRSLAQLSGMMTLDGTIHSSPTKASALLRKDTLLGSRGSNKPSVSSGARGRNSNPEMIDVFSENKDRRREKRHEKIDKFLDLASVNIYLLIITMYALIGEECGLIIAPTSKEETYDVINSLAIASFFVEMLLNVIAKKEYRWSFFFWLDLISTLSMLLDFSFIPSQVINSQADTTQIARAGRVSKIGARAGRVVKIVRLVRIGKLYKTAKENEKQLIQKTHTQSIQSLTNLVDNIAKYKRQTGPLAITRRTSMDPSNKKKMSTMKDFKSGSHKAHQEIEEEKTPLSAQQTYAPRRLSKFAIQRKISDNDIATGMQKRRIEPTKTLMSSVTEVRKQFSKDEGQDYDEQKLKESRVSKTLAEMTTKRVIIIVLALLFVVPLLAAENWSDTNRSYTYDVSVLQKLWTRNPTNKTLSDLLVSDIITRHEDTITPVLWFQVPNGTVIHRGNYDYWELRSSEVDVLNTSGYEKAQIVMNLVPPVRGGAMANTARTLFVCVLLGVGAMLFTKDANDLVLRPLERMIERVNRIAVSPLSVKREGLMDETKKKLETAVLENAITKIGTLLALGFGDAGAEIIAQNIAQAGDMNPMSSGEKIMAVFGFCDIRNFTDATEVLQEDVMVFVNSIADIVHDKVDKYGGSANKNIGDAFLLVWKFPNSEIEDMDDELQLKNTDIVKGLSDLSLFSFMKIFAKINQSHVLRKYRSNAKLLARLPNYRVKMGFGLHVGWAIEGAIGSEYKIDASYLSPNVNIASRLEAATKQYGVPLLISSDLFVLFSDEVQKFCRKIDVVTVKGSQVPIGFYTVDTDPTGLRDKGPSKRTKKDKVTRHEIKKLKLQEMIWEGKLSTHLLFEKDKDLKILMKGAFDQDIKALWDEGFEAYMNGDWKKARLKFDRYLVVRENDGPSQTLLNFMKSLSYEAPIDWRGFRELTEK